MRRVPLKKMWKEIKGIGYKMHLKKMWEEWMLWEKSLIVLYSFFFLIINTKHVLGRARFKKMKRLKGKWVYALGEEKLDCLCVITMDNWKWVDALGKAWLLLPLRGSFICNVIWYIKVDDWSEIWNLISNKLDYVKEINLIIRENNYWTY